jgi:hypothetical protein
VCPRSVSSFARGLLPGASRIPRQASTRRRVDVWKQRRPSSPAGLIDRRGGHKKIGEGYEDAALAGHRSMLPVGPMQRPVKAKRSG